jgi:hypothetical protein
MRSRLDLQMTISNIDGVKDKIQICQIFKSRKKHIQNNRRAERESQVRYRLIGGAEHAEPGILNDRF